MKKRLRAIKKSTVIAIPPPLRSRIRRKCGFALCLLAALFCSASHAVDPVYTDLTARLGGGTVLNASADALVRAVREQVKATPKKSAQVVHLVLASGRADAYKIAPSMVAVAIEALGEKPAPGMVGKIVAAAVKATPTEVLPIVKTAVRAAPGQENANAIVTAAVRSVPDPNEKITLRPASGGGDHKNIRDHKSAPENIGESLPVKDAIVKAVAQADPSLDLAQLQAAAAAGVLAGPLPVDSYNPFDPSIDKFPLVSRLGGGFVAGPQAAAIPTPFPTPPKKPVSP